MICTVLYILVSGVLTGLVNYRALNVAAPVAVGIDATGVRWGIDPGEDRRGVRAGHGDAGDAAGPVAGVLLDVAGWAALEVGGGHSSEVPDAVDLEHRGGAIVAFMPALCRSTS